MEDMRGVPSLAIIYSTALSILPLNTRMRVICWVCTQGCNHWIGVSLRSALGDTTE